MGQQCDGASGVPHHPVLRSTSTHPTRAPALLGSQPGFGGWSWEKVLFSNGRAGHPTPQDSVRLKR